MASDEPSTVVEAQGESDRIAPELSGSSSTADAAPSTREEQSAGPEEAEAAAEEEGEAVEETVEAEEEEEEYIPGDPVEYDRFMFPHALDRDNIDDQFKNISTEAEDTDDIEDMTVIDRIKNAKVFKDPETNQLWKDRTWKAVQCCGGALLVLALIFDEMD